MCATNTYKFFIKKELIFYTRFGYVNMFPSYIHFCTGTQQTSTLSIITKDAHSHNSQFNIHFHTLNRKEKSPRVPLNYNTIFPSIL